MISNHQVMYRLRQVGTAVLLALLMLSASLILLYRYALAGHSGGGGFSCGNLAGAVAGANDGDIAFMHTVPTAESDPVNVNKNIIIQGGWSKIDTNDCPSANPYFDTITDVLAVFTYDPDDISPVDVGHSDGRTLIIQSSVSTLTIQQIEFRDNSRGGVSGVIDNGAEVRLEKVIFRDNWANGGGGLNLEVRGGSRLVISDSQFIQNYSTSNNGGGFHIAVYDNSQVLIHNTRVLTNRTGGSGKGGGGYIIIDSGVVTVSNSTFVGNQAIYSGSGDDDGGGLSIASTNNGPATVWLINNVFRGNTTEFDGGGLELRGNGLNVHLRNNIFAENDADGSGAGIYIGTGPVVDILHTTIADVTTNAKQGIYVAGGTVQITNTIIANHTSGIQRVGGTVSEDYNLFFGNTSNLFGTIASGGHSLTGNPDFVNPAIGDYHLGPNSAALDRAVEAGVTTDFEGDNRPIGAGPDIGADERSVNVYLPLVIKD